MADENVDATQFAELRDIVKQLADTVSDLNISLRDHGKDNEALNQRMTCLKEDNLELWRQVNKNTDDVNSAHGKLRAYKLAGIVGWTVSMAMGSILYGMVVWYISSFVARADSDHDLLVRGLTNQEYILRWIQQHEKRNSTSYNDLQPRDGWEHLPPPSGSDTTYPVLPFPRTPLEEQPEKPELHSERVILVQVHNESPVWKVTLSSDERS
jgi:hypothetical protein